MNNISVIIPTYKNENVFIENIRHNLPYLKDCEVIVVNDDPGTSIQENITSLKNIKLIENKKNVGFGESINLGVLQAKGKYIMLLNSDVKLINSDFKKAVEHFNSNEKLFAVSFAQKEKNNAIVGKNILYWNKGFMQHSKADDQTFGVTAWAEGGSCIIDKKKFIELGGFDRIYSPFYWEDIDLSYRAWKKGYRIVFDPQIQVIHHHESTIGKYFSKNKIGEISFRNQLIFIWKNIDDKKLLLENLFYIIPTLCEGRGPFISGFLEWIVRLPLVIMRRMKTGSHILSDSEILDKFENSLENSPVILSNIR